MKSTLRITGLIATLGMVLIHATGCVPIQRMEMSTSEEKTSISPEKYSISASILTQTSDPAQQPGIDTNLSFAVSPAGKRFNLGVKKNEYAAEWAKNNNSPWMLDNLSLIDPSRQTGNRDPIRWKNGHWKLDLFFTPPTSLQPIYSEFRIYTHWWCPIFERPF